MQSGDIILKHECIGFVEKAKVYGKMVKSLHKVRERVAKEMLKSLPVAIAAAMQRVLAEHVGACRGRAAAAATTASVVAIDASGWPCRRRGGRGVLALGKSRGRCRRRSWWRRAC